jgi:TetR/AcrR family transcriptional regulator
VPDTSEEYQTARAAQAERTAFTEKAILDAAEAVFARRGLSGTRVREIAEAAGVNGATLYNYYPSKSALYEAVLERGVVPLAAMVERFSAGPRELESVRALVGEVMCHLAGHPDFSRLVYLEAIAEGPYLATRARKWFGPLVGFIVGELKSGPLPETIEEPLLPLMAALFIHVSFGHFVLAPLVKETLDTDPLSEEGVERQARFIDALILQLFPHLGRGSDDETEGGVGG